MIRRILAVALMCTLFITNSAFAASIGLVEESNLKLSPYADSDIITELSVVGSDGEVLNGASVSVFSYLENRNVANCALDENRRAVVKYQPSENVLKKSLKGKKQLDVQYAVFVVSNEEFNVISVTKTYGYSKGKRLAKASSFGDGDVLMSINQDRSMEVQTQKISEMSDVIVSKASEADVRTKDVNDNMNMTVGSEITKDGNVGALGAPNPNYGTIIYTKDLGSKNVQFAKIEAAKGCSIQSKISAGSSITLACSGMMTTSVTNSISNSYQTSSISVSTPSTYKFYTAYNFKEDRCYIMAGGYRVEFNRLRIANWNGGITYSSSYQAKNDIAYTTIKRDSTCALLNPGSTQTTTSGRATSIGSALSINSVIAPSQAYSISATYTAARDTDLSRTVGANNKYYQYGTDALHVQRNIVIGEPK